MMISIFAALLTIIVSVSWHAEACEDWFKRLKIAPNDSECKMKCAMGEVDMGTFDCPSRCDILCKSQKKKSKNCQLNQYWDHLLNAPTEPFPKLKGDELQTIKNILSRMPRNFTPQNLKAIVRASVGVDVTSSSLASSSDEYLILFPKAFLRPSELPRGVAHELSHFLIENEWRGLFQKYKQASGWNSIKAGGKYRDGDFVDFDGKFSPEEDLANNVEFYLFEPGTLKSKSPKLFDWIKTTLGATLQLEKGCANAK